MNKIRGVKYKLRNEDNVISVKTANTNDIYLGDDRPSFSRELDEEAKSQKEKEMTKAKVKEHFGFIAQELMEIYPEVVEYDSLNDTYGIQYTALIPIMIQGMKEQQCIINAQSLKLKELEQKIENPDKKTGNLKSANITKEVAETDITTNAFLYQNIPNPFTFNTEIKYYIPENSNNAVLYVFNLQGNLLMSEKIFDTGNGSIAINGSLLNPGMYVYSLLIDGQEVDTKRMILTK